MADSGDLYKRIKVAGAITFIPFVLAAGPLSGYLAGSFLAERYGAPGWLTVACIAIGLIASVNETIAIIRKLLRMVK